MQESSSSGTNSVSSNASADIDQSVPSSPAVSVPPCQLEIPGDSSSSDKMLASGTTVLLNGFTTAEGMQLNGRKAIVVGFGRPVATRYEVRLLDPPLHYDSDV